MPLRGLHFIYLFVATSKYFWHEDERRNTGMDKKIITYTIVAIVAFFALDRAAIIINTLLQYFMFGLPLVFQGQNVIWYNLINFI